MRRPGESAPESARSTPRYSGRMKTLHAPQHMSQNLDANLATILRLKPTTVTLTEQDNGDHDNVARIRAKVGHKYHVCSGPGVKGTHDREVVVLIRKSPIRKVTAVHHFTLSAQQVSKGANPGIANDRHMVVVEYEGPRRKYAHIGTHWNAVIQDKATGRLLSIPRAQAMDAKAGPLLEGVLARYKFEKRYVTGSADFNWRDGHEHHRDWKYAPHNILTRAGYGCAVEGLDWQFWCFGFKVVDKVVIPASKPGHPTDNHSDHPWILTTLAVR